MGQSSEENNLMPVIEGLLMRELAPKSVKEHIVNFFRAFDEYKEDQVLQMQAKLGQEKQRIKKMRNVQASSYSDKSELENLFLDCIDENRKDVLRNFTNGHLQAVNEK